MPRVYFRLDGNREPVEDPEDADEITDRQRLRWSTWMERFRNLRERVTEFRGGGMIGDGTGISIVTQFMGFTDTPRSSPNFPGPIFATKLIGPFPDPPFKGWKRYDRSRTDARDRHLQAIVVLRNNGFIGPTEQPTRTADETAP